MTSVRFTAHVTRTHPVAKPKLDLSPAMDGCGSPREDSPTEDLSLRSQFDSDSDDDDDDDHDSMTTDSSDADTDASPTEDITVMLYDIPEIVVTPPADGEASFFRTSPDTSFLDAESWSLPAMLSALLDPTTAAGLCAAACTNFSLRQQLIKTFALARKYGLPVPDTSLLDNAWPAQNTSAPISPPLDSEEDTTTKGPAASHAPLVDASFVKHQDPCTSPANIPEPAMISIDPTASIEFTIQAHIPTPIPSSPSLPTIIITPPDDGDRPPPAPPSPLDAALLDATPWDLLAYRRALAQPAWAGALELRARADPRLARQLAQAFAVARGADIPVPTLEESRAAREAAEARKRMMAQEWARTCAAATVPGPHKDGPVPRRWKAVGQGRGRPLRRV